MMSLPLPTVSVKWDPETLRMCNELQAAFALFVDNRSQLTRLLVKIVHQLVLTNGVEAVVVNHLRTSEQLKQRAAPRDINSER